MLNNLDHLIQINTQLEQYFISLPKYVQEAANKHAEEIDSENALHLFAETFMRDDSYRGA
jgi:hypothetical protein